MEILVEEPSAEAFLRGLLPRFIEGGATFELYPYNGKQDLLNKLPARLAGYSRWLPPSYRIIVLLDCDYDDCVNLKRIMEENAVNAGLLSRTAAQALPWQIVNRIAIHELEAWYFGDWNAVKQAYPRVPSEIPRREGYRDPDKIAGGTWEAFERILQSVGYYKGGLRKIEAARAIGAYANPLTNRSNSFSAFRDAVLEAVR
ncbi:MAG: DUF4276 family protein [Rhodomicrobium sp.]